MTNQNNHDDDCPVCQKRNAGEAHVAECIETHLSQLSVSEPQLPIASPDSSQERLHPIAHNNNQNQCPVCQKSFSSNGLDGDREACEAHVAACIDSATSNASQPIVSEKRDPDATPRYLTPSGQDSLLTTSFSQPESHLSHHHHHHHHGGLRGLFSRDPVKKEEKTRKKQTEIDSAIIRRWGMPGTPRHEMVMRYWAATRMVQHWNNMRQHHHHDFLKYMQKGYMDPIPIEWVQNQTLAFPYPEGSMWETPAEKRLYYLLNNGILPNGVRPAHMRPLNIVRDRNTIIRRGNARNALQHPLDSELLASYRSPGDVFLNSGLVKSHEYSPQVDNITYEARTRSLHELADGIIHGTDHLETMILVDVSGSMLWEPYKGVWGPDGVVRYHDQPPNIALVEHLVHRALYHMVPRAQKEHPNQQGIPTVTFSTYGTYVGDISARNFPSDWGSKVRSRYGGATQIMRGWQVVKNTYFEQQHQKHGHGLWDPVFGWQPTPGMPKLSLLVFLDGEANDMDEFELELLGETWAYVTIALVGMENCPHHHSHAIELERVTKFNPHVGFFDVHGRVCERLVVQDLLKSVYPVDPPEYSEIVKPEYDLHPEPLPSYSAY